MSTKQKILSGTSIWGFWGQGVGPNKTDLLQSMQRFLAHRSLAWMHHQERDVCGLAQGFDDRRVVSPGVAWSESGRICCVMDGYLLNHQQLRKRLRGLGVQGALNRDALIVANLYAHLGEDAWTELDGAFAIALRDQERFFLVRDALGEKPVYYAPDVKGRLLFASEVKSFLADPHFDCSPVLTALYQLMVFSFVPGEETVFQGARELPPGSFLTCGRDGQIRLHKYWSIRENIDTSFSEEEFVEQTRQTLFSAVSNRVASSTGRIGALLSGGVDSSAVVAVLNELGVDLSVYSLGFGPGHVNELDYAQMVARHRNIQTNVVEFRPDMFVENLSKVVWHLDDPLCDCITVPNFILSQQAAADVDVLFNGEGGDPVFGGPKNKFLILGELYSFLGGYDRLKSYLTSYHKAYVHLEELFTADFLHAVPGPESLEKLVHPYLNNPQMTEFLNRMFHINICLKGGHNILIKVDKMFSANGVQPCSPLFDRQLTELAFRIPCQLKRRGDIEKYVFKKAVENLLPEPVVYRRKTGMGVPLNHWFRSGPLREHALELLSRDRLLDRGYFCPDFVQSLFTGELPAKMYGRNRTGEILWMLLAVEQWHRIFVDGEWRKMQ